MNRHNALLALVVIGLALLIVGLATSGWLAWTGMIGSGLALIFGIGMVSQSQR